MSLSIALDGLSLSVITLHIKTTWLGRLFLLAEREGFEPSRGLAPP